MDILYAKPGEIGNRFLVGLENPMSTGPAGDDNLAWIEEMLANMSDEDQKALEDALDKVFVPFLKEETQSYENSTAVTDSNALAAMDGNPTELATFQSRNLDFVVSFSCIAQPIFFAVDGLLLVAVFIPRFLGGLLKNTFKKLGRVQSGMTSIAQRVGGVFAGTGIQAIPLAKKIEAIAGLVFSCFALVGTSAIVNVFKTNLRFFDFVKIVVGLVGFFVALFATVGTALTVIMITRVVQVVLLVGQIVIWAIECFE